MNSFEFLSFALNSNGLNLTGKSVDVSENGEYTVSEDFIHKAINVFDGITRNILSNENPQQRFEIAHNICVMLSYFERDSFSKTKFSGVELKTASLDVLKKLGGFGKITKPDRFVWFCGEWLLEHSDSAQRWLEEVEINKHKGFNVYVNAIVDYQEKVAYHLANAIKNILTN